VCTISDEKEQTMSLAPSAPRLDRSGYELVFEEHFDQESLDASRWVDHYLPHWTTPERSQAHYAVTQDGLRLRIDADQPSWRNEDGELRVSSLQTGSFSGAEGSPVGQHRHRDDLTVVTAQPAQHLYVPSSGLVEATLRASTDPTVMLAFWLVGFEEASPQQAGELCVVEIFGHAIEDGSAALNIGLKAHHDPQLSTDMATVLLPLDATDWHTYAAEWGDEGVRFYVDDQLVRTVSQPLGYPLQLMVSLFEFPVTTDRNPVDYPKHGDVRSVRGYRRRTATRPTG
jgi:hypothetical protein